MADERITVVVGAGASNELGLPLGGEMRFQIRDALTFSYDSFRRFSGGNILVREALTHLAGSGEYDNRELFSAARHIVDAVVHQPSIDAFIDTQRGTPEVAICGKLAIVENILNHERNSEIRIRDNGGRRDTIDFQHARLGWVHTFFQMLSNGCDVHEFSERMDRISFVIFNYDRCVEHYLFEATMNLYLLDAEDAAKILDRLHIVHPYGAVGALPWQTMTGGQAGIHFGCQLQRDGLITLAREIKTYSEQVDDPKELQRIRQPVADAEKLVFLGFAFHPLNLELLRTDGDKNVKRIYGSAFQMSHPDIEHTKTSLVGFQKTPGTTMVLDRDLKANEFLNNYKIAIGL